MSNSAKRVRVHEKARIEIAETACWYNDRSTLLGDSFTREVWACVDRIVRCPEAFGRIHKTARLHRLNRFPHGVVYDIRDDQLWVLAVVHPSRESLYWLDRLADVGSGA